jgi:hypothetical protein
VETLLSQWLVQQNIQYIFTSITPSVFQQLHLVEVYLAEKQSDENPQLIDDSLTKSGRKWVGPLSSVRGD